MTFRVPLMLFFRSVAVGLVAAIALGALAFAAAPFFDAVGVYITPAKLLVPVMGPVIPSRLVYWLMPDGGAAAGVFFILASAILFWTIFFGVAYFAWATLRHRRAAEKTTRANS